MNLSRQNKLQQNLPCTVDPPPGYCRCSVRCKIFHGLCAHRSPASAPCHSAGCGKATGTVCTLAGSPLLWLARARVRACRCPSQVHFTYCGSSPLLCVTACSSAVRHARTWHSDKRHFRSGHITGHRTWASSMQNQRCALACTSALRVVEPGSRRSAISEPLCIQRLPPAKHWYETSPCCCV